MSEQFPVPIEHQEQEDRRAKLIELLRNPETRKSPETRALFVQLQVEQEILLEQIPAESVEAFRLAQMEYVLQLSLLYAEAGGMSSALENAYQVREYTDYESRLGCVSYDEARMIAYRAKFERLYQAIERWIGVLEEAKSQKGIFLEEMREASEKFQLVWQEAKGEK